MKEAGLPDGVLNLVTGSGRKIGKAIIASHDVAGIVFTGSKMAGYKIMEQSRTIRPRPIIAELGGKNPVVVTENADIDKPAEGIIKATLVILARIQRVLKGIRTENVKELLIKRLVEKTRNLSIGNPPVPNAFMGPLINSNAYKNYQKFAKIASRDGRIIIGGTVKRSKQLSMGICRAYNC